ncbi:MAG: DUF2330 domain-containing protein [Myxococcota bacterium]
MTLVMWALTQASTAWACAGLVHTEDTLAESDAAEVLYEVGDGTVTVTYGVRFEGDATELGWVIPVPGPVELVSDGNAEILASYRELSSPTVYRFADDAGTPTGCGCGAVANDKAGGSLESRGGDNAVTVVGYGFTGTYDYTLVTAADAAALTAWFDDHGWAGLPAEDIDYYVATGQTFAAIQVSVGADQAEDHALPPISIRYQGDTLSFPAVMARHASVPTQRTTLYVVGDTRATVADGWTQDDTDQLSGALSDDPLDLWTAHLTALGADRTYARTYADRLPESVFFLTRFDTLAPTAVHDRDVVLAFEDSIEPLGVEIDLEGSGSGAAGIPLGLLALLWLRRRLA